MKKYSVEWKNKKKAWAQKNDKGIWRVHYIRRDTEYTLPQTYYTMRAAEETARNYRRPATGLKCGGGVI